MTDNFQILKDLISNIRQILPKEHPQIVITLNDLGDPSKATQRGLDNDLGVPGIKMSIQPAKFDNECLPDVLTMRTRTIIFPIYEGASIL